MFGYLVDCLSEIVKETMNSDSRERTMSVVCPCLGLLLPGLPYICVWPELKTLKTYVFCPQHLHKRQGQLEWSCT